MKITRAGVAIAKSVFHGHGVDCHDQPQWQVKRRRGQWIGALRQRLAGDAEVGMEACDRHIIGDANCRSVGLA